MLFRSNPSLLLLRALLRTSTCPTNRIASSSPGLGVVFVMALRHASGLRQLRKEQRRDMNEAMNVVLGDASVYQSDLVALFAQVQPEKG